MLSVNYISIKLGEKKNQINLRHHINRIKDTCLIEISIEAEKAYAKIPYLFPGNKIGKSLEWKKCLS